MGQSKQVTFKASRTFGYQRTTKHAGDLFQCSREEAKVMEGNNWGKIQKPPTAKNRTKKEED